MESIIWRGYRRVPSWSWLSKVGPIKYMDLEFEKIDWATRDFEGPFGRRKSANHKMISKDDLTTLKGQARRLNITKKDLLVRVSFDGENEYDVDKLRCMVIGRDKTDNGTNHPKQHVLIIHSFNPLEEGVYERVGVASLLSDHVSEVQSLVTIV